MAEFLQPTLDIGLVTVHCCFCPRLADATSADTAHRAMEDHYDTEHAVLIGRLLGQEARTYG
jgi:hypothetical protein